MYDYDEPAEGPQPYLVMELVDGPCLADALAGGPLDAARTMDLVAQAAAGLQAAHATGLVHGDIRPGNLLLASSGTVKITDWGASRAIGSVPVTVTGTAEYLAPERIAGAAAGPASDLYALGVVAYECLAGAPPFLGDPPDVARAHRGRPVPPLPGNGQDNRNGNGQGHGNGFAPQIAANGGGVIPNVLSGLSWVSFPEIGAYCAAKSAEWSLTNALRVQLADQNIRVAGLHVGYMDTDMVRAVDAGKSDPADIARIAVDGIAAGAYEILADNAARQAQAALAEGVATLYPQLP